MKGSNLLPADQKSVALPTELSLPKLARRRDFSELAPIRPEPPDMFENLKIMRQVAFLYGKSCKSSRKSCDSCRTAHQGRLAGVVGFEPTISCTKNSCPTARPHPNRAVVVKPVEAGVQVPIFGEMRRLAIASLADLIRCHAPKSAFLNPAAIAAR